LKINGKNKVDTNINNNINEYRELSSDTDNYIFNNIKITVKNYNAINENSISDVPIEVDKSDSPDDSTFMCRSTSIGRFQPGNFSSDYSNFQANYQGRQSIYSYAFWFMSKDNHNLLTSYSDKMNDISLVSTWNNKSYMKYFCQFYIDVEQNDNLVSFTDKASQACYVKGEFLDNIIDPLNNTDSSDSDSDDDTDSDSDANDSEAGCIYSYDLVNTNSVSI